MDIDTRPVKYQTGGVLNASAIIEAIKTGDIIIHPFNPENLGTNSYDVCVGKYYWTQSITDELGVSAKGYKKLGLNYKCSNLLMQKNKTRTLHDPYDVSKIRSRWTLKKAISVRAYADDLSQIMSQYSLDLHLRNNSKIIIVNPGDHILGHTQEYIGGKNNIFATLASRSSTRREGEEVCRDAGIGDIGYRTRWTLEIGNSTDLPIILVVGNRYGQILFNKCVDVEMEVNSDDKYVSYGSKDTNDTKYQTNGDVETNKLTWHPYKLLPKKYMDREMQFVDHDNEFKTNKKNAVIKFKEIVAFQNHMHTKYTLNQQLKLPRSEAEFTENEDSIIISKMSEMLIDDLRTKTVDEIDRTSRVCAQIEKFVHSIESVNNSIDRIYKMSASKLNCYCDYCLNSNAGEIQRPEEFHAIVQYQMYYNSLFVLHLFIFYKLFWIQEILEAYDDNDRKVFMTNVKNRLYLNLHARFDVLAKLIMDSLDPSTESTHQSPKLNNIIDTIFPYKFSIRLKTILPIQKPITLERKIVCTCKSEFSVFKFLAKTFIDFNKLANDYC